jgi:DNA-directed RNA polymerase sigma subunit (sigma70/sigma32)
MDRNLALARRMEATRRRNAKIVAMHSRGATKEMIGKRFRLTRERIRQIVAAARPRRPVAP